MSDHRTFNVEREHSRHTATIPMWQHCPLCLCMCFKLRSSSAVRLAAASSFESLVESTTDDIVFLSACGERVGIGKPRKAPPKHLGYLETERGATPLHPAIASACACVRTAPSPPQQGGRWRAQLSEALRARPFQSVHPSRRETHVFAQYARVGSPSRLSVCVCV